MILYFHNKRKKEWYVHLASSKGQRVAGELWMNLLQLTHGWWVETIRLI